MADPPYLIFISHAWSDRWIARQPAAIMARESRHAGTPDLEAGARVMRCQKDARSMTIASGTTSRRRGQEVIRHELEKGSAHDLLAGPPATSRSR
jgi:hypothetical protein